MRPLRFALFGTGFWSRFQLAGWQEIGGVECVALYNRTEQKARDLAARAGLSARIYQDPCELFEREHLDFVDIVTSPETHGRLVALAAERRLPVICQKPMASSYGEAVEMVEICRRAGVPFYVNENWRWQAPIRALKKTLESGAIGTPCRARLRMVSGFPVFENQPFLRELEQFLLMDIGSHILDVARFLFGEPVSLYCSTQKVHRGICGEDMATVLLRFAGGQTLICELGYPGIPLETDHFPQTFALIEGESGSVELGPNYSLRITTAAGTSSEYVKPPHYSWADPAYEVVHASIVPCQADLLAGLRREKTPETTGEDNLRTMRLVHEAYESAKRNEVVHLQFPSGRCR